MHAISPTKLAKIASAQGRQMDDPVVKIGATADGVSHLSGVERCSSPWSCPVCAPVIGERRAKEIDLCVADWMGKGGTVWFVTATLRHQLGDDLAALLEVVQRAWSSTWRWKKARPAWYGAQIRTVEITHGGNGWHPHVHSLIFVPPGSDASGFLDSMRYDWERSVNRQGGTTDVRSKSSPGWDVRPVHRNGNVDKSALGSYLTKVEGGWGAGLELARLDLKRQSVTPFALLALAAKGDKRAAFLWAEYEHATLGRRRIVASPGLLAMVDDTEAAEEQVSGEIAVEVELHPKAWKDLCRSGAACYLRDDLERLASGELDRSGWRWPPGWLRWLAAAGSTGSADAALPC